LLTDDGETFFNIRVPQNELGNKMKDNYDAGIDISKLDILKKGRIYEKWALMAGFPSFFFRAGYCVVCLRTS
jgi:hypothetical protein